jgi:hypothetical protein
LPIAQVFVHRVYVPGTMRGGRGGQEAAASSRIVGVRRVTYTVGPLPVSADHHVGRTFSVVMVQRKMSTVSPCIT